MRAWCCGSFSRAPAVDSGCVLVGVDGLSQVPLAEADQRQMPFGAALVVAAKACTTPQCFSSLAWFMRVRTEPLPNPCPGKLRQNHPADLGSRSVIGGVGPEGDRPGPARCGERSWPSLPPDRVSSLGLPVRLEPADGCEKVPVGGSGSVPAAGHVEAGRVPKLVTAPCCPLRAAGRIAAGRDACRRHPAEPRPGEAGRPRYGLGLTPCCRRRALAVLVIQGAEDGRRAGRGTSGARPVRRSWRLDAGNRRQDRRSRLPAAGPASRRAQPRTGCRTARS